MSEGGHPVVFLCLSSRLLNHLAYPIDLTLFKSKEFGICWTLLEHILHEKTEAERIEILKQRFVRLYDSADSIAAEFLDIDDCMTMLTKDDAESMNRLINKAQQGKSDLAAFQADYAVARIASPMWFMWLVE